MSSLTIVMIRSEFTTARTMCLVPSNTLGAEGVILPSHGLPQRAPNFRAQNDGHCTWLATHRRKRHARVRGREGSRKVLGLGIAPTLVSR